MIDTTELKFPKPVKKSKKSSFGKKPKLKKEKEVIVFVNEVQQMIDFYETHRGDMVSVENYRFTQKLQEQASLWIRDVMQTQKCDDVKDVLLAWQNTILHAAEKAHPSHKVGSFMNFWWIVKNDYNFLEIIEGKYDREFIKTTKGRGIVGTGDPKDFEGVASGPSGTIV